MIEKDSSTNKTRGYYVISTNLKEFPDGVKIGEDKTSKINPSNFTLNDDSCTLLNYYVHDLLTRMEEDLNLKQKITEVSYKEVPN